MKALLDFIKYNNAFPVILFVTLLATGAVFAASPELRESVFLPETAPVAVPMKADASKLLSVDINQYDLALRIDALKEDTKAYYVTYSYQTFEIEGNIWQEVRKTKHLDVAKEMLGKRDLKEYLSAQINQVMARNRQYLVEAKRLAQGDTDTSDSLAYGDLVGQSIALGSTDEIPATAEKEEGSETENLVSEPVSVMPAPFLSQEDLQKMIVAAVADFLAIDMSMPEAAQEETPIPEPLPESQTEEVYDASEDGVSGL